MHESERKAFLHAMGVKPLLPRYAFPGASAITLVEQNDPPAQDIAFVEAVEEAEIATNAFYDNVDAGVPQEFRESVQAGSSETVNEREQLQQDSSVFKGKIDSELEYLANIKDELGVSPKRNKQVKFRHRLVFVGQLLMLIDQPRLEWHEEKQAKTFFQDVHYFLTGRRPEFWRESRFDWPPARFLPVDNEDSIREILYAFIEGQLNEFNCDWLIIWGKKPAANLLGQSMEVGDCQDNELARILQLHELADYFNEPYNKRLLWQHLQSVKKSLN